MSTAAVTPKPSGFVSFLDKVGGFFKKFFAVVIPVLQAEAPLINLIAPGAATAINLVANAVLAVENQFAAAGNQAGTGAQKSAQVISIVGPAVIQLLAQEGIVANTSTIQNIINAVVAGLNAIPAPTQPALVPATPAISK